jgi:hypothetical protein
VAACSLTKDSPLLSASPGWPRVNISGAAMVQVRRQRTPEGTSCCHKRPWLQVLVLLLFLRVCLPLQLSCHGLSRVIIKTRLIC